VTVRNLTLHDFGDAHALYMDLVGDIDVPDGSAGQEQFQRLLSHPGTLVIGAEAGGMIVSMLTLHLLPNMTFSARPYALIENVVTRRDWQGQGFGRAVVQTAIETAWAKDAYKIMLLTGQSFAARGFYERLGFNATDKHGMILRRAPNRSPKPRSA
jgi:GNAT superfamily N-acetyltransferase